MLDKYIDEQKIVTKLLSSSLNNNKLVQAYLFSSDDIEYIFNYAKDFAKAILNLSGQDEDILNNIYKKIDKDEYNELKIIKPDGKFIKKEQLIELQNSLSNKPVEGNKMIYIIRNCECLNDSSANSILKFIEEPEEDTIAILLTNNINMVIPTIKSRCQVLNFENTIFKGDSIEIFKKYIIDNYEEYEEEYFKSLIDSSEDFVKYIESKGKNTLIYVKKMLWDIFKLPSDILILLNFMIYLYTDSLYSKMNLEIKYMNEFLDLISLICEKNDKEKIVSKICILEELKKEVKMNANTKLLFDKLIIELSEV